MRKPQFLNIPDTITDEFIINIFIKNQTTIKSRLNKIFFDKYPLLQKYLNERFNDSSSYSETLYRIYHHIILRPTCPICNNSVTFISFSKGFSTHCSCKCAQNDISVRNKFKLTNIIKYGAQHMWSNKNIRQKCYNTKVQKYGCGNNMEKIKNTNLSRYNVEFPYQNPEFLNKAKLTMLKHYGVDNVRKDINYIKLCFIEKLGADNPSKIKEIYNKVKQTNLQKYGSITPLGNKEIREKSRNTQYKKYNGLLFVQTPEFLKKSYNSKKLHKSFNTSKIEDKFKKYLIEHNIEFIPQYKSEQYPYNCDFYIIKYDLYLELNIHWTHGFKPYNENNINDQKQLIMWQNKNTKFYNDAIKTWTVRDVNKRKTAQKNNLNYLEIFTNNITKVIEEFENYISKKYYNIQ